MPTPQPSDRDALMSDDQYDESTDQDLEAGPDSGESKEDGDDPDSEPSENTFQFRKISNMRLRPHCVHQRVVFVLKSYFGEEVFYVKRDELGHYKRRRRLPFGSIHRSRFEDLWRCCEKLCIPEQTAMLAHFL